MADDAVFVPEPYMEALRRCLGDGSDDALAKALAEILADHRRHVIGEVIRAVRASAHECAGSGRPRVAQERFALIGFLRKTFGVSAGLHPSARKRRYRVISLEALYARDGGVCQLGDHPISLEEATRDHIDPLGAGGRHKRSNIQLACRPCNELKGSGTRA